MALVGFPAQEAELATSANGDITLAPLEGLVTLTVFEKAAEVAAP
jgi:hypothetical protein